MFFLRRVSNFLFFISLTKNILSVLFQEYGRFSTGQKYVKDSRWKLSSIPEKVLTIYFLIFLWQKFRNTPQKTWFFKPCKNYKYLKPNWLIYRNLGNMRNFPIFHHKKIVEILLQFVSLKNYPLRQNTHFFLLSNMILYLYIVAKILLLTQLQNYFFNEGRILFYEILGSIILV